MALVLEGRGTVDYNAQVSFFSKLFGPRASHPSQTSTPRDPSGERVVLPTPGNPSELHPIPGNLSVRVHAHDPLGVEGAFITLVSEGLRAEGQREILLTLRARDGDDLEARIVDVASFFGSIHRLAGEGKTVDSGGFTQFGLRGILGGSNNGLLYVDAVPLAGIDLPPNPLAAIVVSSDEIALVRDGVTQRLLARMGELYRTYPFPRWNDLERPSLTAADETASSLLFKVERARTSGVSILAESGHLQIMVAPDARAPLREMFAISTPAGPFAFLTDPATAANACLVWRPGQTEPAAITPPDSDGSRITGLFLLVTGGVERDEVRLLEDGYSLLLGPASLQSFWHSVEKQQPFSSSRCEGMTCALEWSSDRYENPVDGHAGDNGVSQVPTPGPRPSTSATTLR